jgi:hypothetical protein
VPVFFDFQRHEPVFSAPSGGLPPPLTQRQSSEALATHSGGKREIVALESGMAGKGISSRFGAG